MEKLPFAPETIRGQVERITFFNEETGFTVARIKVAGRPDLVTATGILFNPAPGEVLSLTGQWGRHPAHGEEFRVLTFTAQVPATVAGIQKYLGSGLIRGLGPKTAARITEVFGEKTLEIIEAEPERLLTVPGLGRKRLTTIKAAWSEQKGIREVMLFLQSHGVSAAHAARIYKHYGAQALQVVRENPFRLAEDVFGVGFLTADTIAQKLGFEKASPARLQAGIVHVLNQLSDDGHVYFPQDQLVQRAREILEVEETLVLQALQAGLDQGRLVREEEAPLLAQAGLGGRPIYLSVFHFAERSVAARLGRLLTAKPARRDADPAKAAAWVQERLGLTLAQGQAEAVRLAVQSPVLVITGGPGTGKTTIVRAIGKIFTRLGQRVVLAAPTGRAAKRLSEATGQEARTIHRLLEFNFRKGGFQRNEGFPLEADVLVVDEASMIDLLLMHHLLKAVPLRAGLILVGDVNQLPSVGPGNVLRDVIDSGVVPVTALTEIFRQARQSRIVLSAHQINQGRMPDTSSRPDEREDFYFIRQDDPARVIRIILELVRERIPRRFGLDPLEDIQVLSPMNRGLLGTANLNQELQAALNPSGEEFSRGGRVFRTGDKVMQLRNNYDLEVFNGDIGRIRRLDPEEGTLSVDFDGREVAYGPSNLDELVLAYAVSVHKSQGSEYPAVILPLLPQHHLMLQRNLLYTAVTRGKSLVVVVGSEKALAQAVRTDPVIRRFTGLGWRLQRQKRLPVQDSSVTL